MTSRCSRFDLQKADKRHLENKVNRSVFDTACEELNRMIKELLDKMFGHVSSWFIHQHYVVNPFPSWFIYSKGYILSFCQLI